MRVVIDTNVIISSNGKSSPNRKIFDALINGEFELCITNDIFLEYKEIIANKTNNDIAKNFANLLSILQNVHFINLYYKWDLIIEDPDDNKFVDCYISSNSQYLITEDKHFEAVRQLDFPKINLISAKYFILNNLKNKIL